MDAMPEGKGREQPQAADARPTHRRARKYFTVDEANALLPILERQLCDLQELYRGAREKYTEIRKLQAVGYKEDGTLIMDYDYRQAKKAFDEMVDRMNALIEDINRPGCLLKEIETGLVDFPSIIQGKEVLLCWRLGEPMVTHFHSFEEGYTGRRPLFPDER